MADIFIIKRQLKTALWIFTALTVIGLFAMWNAHRDLEFSPSDSGFLLATMVTLFFAGAWICTFIALLGASWFLSPSKDRKSRIPEIPWWIVKTVLLLVVILGLSIFLWDLSAKTTNAFTLLKKGRLERLQEKLQENPAILKRKDSKTKKTLLELAIESGDADALKVLFDAGENLEGNPNASLWLLMYAGNPEILQLLLEHGAKPDLPGPDGEIPLHYATGLRNPQSVAVLLDAGADVNVLDENFRTPLIRAVMQGTPAIVNILIAHGADLNRPDRIGDTALHKAVRRRDTKIARILVKKGADPSILNFSGRAPIHLAADMGQIPMIRLFISASDEQLNLPDEQGLSAFDHAVCSHQDEAAEYLLEQGVDINRLIPDSNQTITHFVLQERDYDAAKFLIEQGADVRIPDEKGETAYFFMRKKKMVFLLDLVDERDSPESVDAKNSPEKEKPSSDTNEKD